MGPPCARKKCGPNWDQLFHNFPTSLASLSPLPSRRPCIPIGSLAWKTERLSSATGTPLTVAMLTPAFQSGGSRCIGEVFWLPSQCPPSLLSLVHQTVVAQANCCDGNLRNKLTDNHQCHPDATLPHSCSVTSPYLPHLQLTPHQTLLPSTSFVMVHNVHHGLLVVEGQPPMMIAGIPTAPMDRQSVPSVTPRPCRQWDHKRQPCGKCKQVNCRNGNLCRDGHTSSPSVNLSDRLDLEFRR